MRETALILIPVWIMLTGAGWLLLGQFSPTNRNLLLPAAPVLGTCVLVAVLHWTTLFSSVRTGLWFVGAAGIVLVVLNFRKDRRWWSVSRSALVLLVLTGALGGIPALNALRPVAVVGDSGAIQATNNNDAFFYASVINWVTNHPGIEKPRFRMTPQDGGDPPSYLPASQQLDSHLRIGDDLVQAAFNVVLDEPASHTWYPLTAMWILLLPAAGFGAARCLHMRATSGLVLGVAVSTASLTIYQLANQNSDSLLGICLAPFAVAAVVQGVGRSPVFGRGLAALMLAALLGSYSEFTPLIVPAFGLAVLARPPREILPAVRSAMVISTLSFAIAPLAWVNAVRSLLLLGGIGADGLASPFSRVSHWQILNRFTGVSTFDAPSTSSGRALVIAATILVGVVAAAVLSARRSFMVALALMGGVLAYYLAAVKHRGYSQLRTIEIWLPLLLLVAVFGWDRLYRSWSVWYRARSEERQPKTATFARLRVLAVLGVLLPGLLWTASNLRTAHRLVANDTFIRARHVDKDFGQAAGWLREVSGPRGSNTMVLAAEYFDQLWITDALRSRGATAYPFLYVSYQAYPRYWNGQLTRWLLVDSAVKRDIDPGMVVHSNARFALVDLERGQGVFGFASSEFGGPGLFLLKTPGITSKVRLTGTTVPVAPATLGVPQQSGATLAPGTLKPGQTVLDFAVTATPDASALLTDGTYSFFVSGVTREAAG